MKTGFNRRIPIGQVVYDYRFESLEHLTCLWFLYPIFLLITRLKYLKFKLYARLNQAGIMQTPLGSIMHWKDLHVNNWLINNISRGELNP